jgi:hypothetical protein
MISEIGSYKAEPFRADASGNWTGTVALETPWPRQEFIDAVHTFVDAKQDPSALLTGYMLGNEGVTYTSSAVFTRDPFPDDTYPTPSPAEYDALLQEFADQPGMHFVPGKLPAEARATVGRRPGYEPESPPLPFSLLRSAIKRAWQPGLEVREGHMFSDRYGDFKYDEEAAIFTCNIRELDFVARCAAMMRQQRFVGETQDYTHVFNWVVATQNRLPNPTLV